MNRDKISYVTSMDYQRLRDLIVAGSSIVCFVAYSFPGDKVYSMDVCIGRTFPEAEGKALFTARGVEYGCFPRLSDMDQFTKECERMKLEFIDLPR